MPVQKLLGMLLIMMGLVDFFAVLRRYTGGSGEWFSTPRALIVASLVTAGAVLLYRASRPIRSKA